MSAQASCNEELTHNVIQRRAYEIDSSFYKEMMLADPKHASRRSPVARKRPSRLRHRPNPPKRPPSAMVGRKNSKNARATAKLAKFSHASNSRNPPPPRELGSLSARTRYCAGSSSSWSERTHCLEKDTNNYENPLTFAKESDKSEP